MTSWRPLFGPLDPDNLRLVGQQPRLHKPFLALGVLLMGTGFLAAGVFTSLLWVSVACALAAVGFGLVSTLGFSLFAALIPRG